LQFCCHCRGEKKGYLGVVYKQQQVIRWGKIILCQVERRLRVETLYLPKFDPDDFKQIKKVEKRYQSSFLSGVEEGFKSTDLNRLEMIKKNCVH